MPLNLGGGPYVPSIRWASSQMAFLMSLQGADGVDMQPLAFQQMLADFWNIRTGWRYVAKGQSPLWYFDPSLEQKIDNPDPTKEYKRGFLVQVYNSQLFHGDNVRHWADSATGAGIGIQQAFAEFEAQMAQHTRAEVPVIQMNGVVNQGNYNVPNLSVVAWTPRPAELIDAAPEPGAIASNGQQMPAQQPPAAPAAPPVPPQQPAYQPAPPPQQPQQPQQPAAPTPPPQGQLY